MQFASIITGPYYKFNETISLMVACETKDEVNLLYKTLVKGGKVLMPLDEYPFSNWYGWISDCYGLNWQIVPKDLSMYLGHGSKDQVERVTKAFLQMKKIDIKTLEKAWKDEL